LATSQERSGKEGRDRYAATIAEATRKVADNPIAPATRARGELSAGMRSIHLRFAPRRGRKAKIERPVWVLYYRVIAPDLIEIVRVLHELMEPSRHIDREITMSSGV
jgi:toxin ParE1/3/4